MTLAQRLRRRVVGRSRTADAEHGSGDDSRSDHDSASTGSTDNDVAVSVDVEDWYHIPAVTGSPFSTYDDVDEFFSSWGGRYDYLTTPTRRTLDLFDELGVTATFFVVADVVDNYPGLVEDIAMRGHSIECHGLHHECAIDPDTKEPRFSREEYREQLALAKRKLEDASGQEVTGFRAPNAYVAGWMLDVLEDLGFEYDSSVARNSLYNKSDADLDATRTSPYVPQHDTLAPGGSDREFVELPWPYYDVAGFEIPAAGGPLIRLFGSTVIERGIRQSLERGDTVFYFHPIDIARESFPNVGNSTRRPSYWLFKGEVAEKRVRSVLETFDDRLTTCGAVANDAMPAPEPDAREEPAPSTPAQR